MKLTHSVRYDAPVADVYAMLTDPAFRERATRAQDALEVSVTVDDASVSIALVQSNESLPGYARAIAGESSRAVQAEQWSDGSEADFSITIPGQPGSISGTRRLVADGQATLDTFDGEATARIPLVGGKIEKLIGDKLKNGWDIEHGVGIEWLEERR